MKHKNGCYFYNFNSKNFWGGTDPRHVRSYGIDSNVGLVTEAATGGDL